MQLTALLDQISQGSSSTWPATAPRSMADLGGWGVLSTPANPGTATPCQQAEDTDLWFAERTADVEQAKALCRSCPVREACLAGALERQEPWGVWGGEVFLDGVVIARKRGRGRPRKDEPTA
ncbi:WhiB family transcriptional regulator [Georgenia sp. AZ-5]|uniref:WhiB family transcriptional regulator n=1 Tax=Georgenia sp. AZ-5 TaxID=3367526 RepID=UPI003754A442